MKAVIFFIIIALMRVIQSVCNKRSSNEVKGTKTFFAYGTYYQALAAVVSIISVAITGFGRLNFATVICGAVTAVFLMINFYSMLYAVKGCTLILTSMASNGGLAICCLVSWVWFGESIGILQGVGLLLFFVAAYLLSAPPKSETGDDKKKISKKTWILLVAVMLSEGCVEISQKYFSIKVGGNSAWYSLFMFAASAAIMSAGFIKENISEKRLQIDLTERENAAKSVILSKTLLICGGLLAIAIFAVNFLVTELGKTVSSIVLFPVSASISICVTVLVGWIVYKEKLTIKNVIGVAAGLLAVILLAI